MAITQRQRTTRLPEPGKTRERTYGPLDGNTRQRNTQSGDTELGKIPKAPTVWDNAKKRYVKQ